MEAEQIQQLRPALNEYLREFDDCFGRREPVEHLRMYVAGRLSDLQRKTMEPIADAAGGQPRNLQHFLSRHAWDEMQMRDTLQQRVACNHYHPCSIGVIDETAHPKKGNKTPGVQRQWCGNTGKKDNCVITVHLNYTAGSFHCLLDGELYLPESWDQDRQRCQQARIPDDMTYRPKWLIALDLYQHAVGNGIRFEWLTFDEAYSRSPEFLFRLDDIGQRYVTEVQKSFTGWLVKPSVLHKEHHRRGRGPRRKFPRLKAKSLPASRVDNLLKYSPILRKIPWEKFHIKDTSKGPKVWEAKAVKFYLKRDGLPTYGHWLIVARNVENPDEIKYFVSNAPHGVPLEVLLHVAFSRWHVERCFQDEKNEVGLSHFEMRNYVSLRRHLILTAVSHLFLAEQHEKWRGEKSGVDGLPGPRCGLGTGSITVGHGPGQTPASTADSRDHHKDTTSPGRCPVLSHQEETEEAA